MQIHELLGKALESGASDIHLVPGQPPIMRVHTRLEPIPGYDVFTKETAEELAKTLIEPQRIEHLKHHLDLDFGLQSENHGRFRVNAHYQKNGLGFAFRSIPQKIPAIADLNLPATVQELIKYPRGLVLVTGATGSGKSTTLASMINAMNQAMNHHIITLEDPIEYEMVSKTCLIEQREVGQDVESFASGLKHALRQDPDVILVGEMRDLETTSAAITAAETGHLVLSTLHTQSAHQTLARIIDIYPPAQQNQIRSMLATTLRAVVTQTLFRRNDIKGMAPACEVMVSTPAVANCIRENRLHEIPNIIETSRQQGMQLLDDSIKGLVLNGLISTKEALTKANHPETLKQALGLV
jgi:twitching motility protein PilT